MFKLFEALKEILSFTILNHISRNKHNFIKYLKKIVTYLGRDCLLTVNIEAILLPEKPSL